MIKILVRVLGVGTMMMTLAMGLQPLGCASSSTSAPLTLQNNWSYITTDGNSGTGLDIKSDNTYVLVRLTAVSGNSYDAQEQIGTLSVAGSTITFTPTSASCRFASDPPYTATYNINGDELTVALSFGVIVFKQNSQTGSGSGSGLVITNGCFQDDQSFVPTPVSPIGSCVGTPGTACSSSACCRGLTCVSDGVCAGTCKSNADCKSGCCPLATDSEGLRGCGPATSCK